MSSLISVGQKLSALALPLFILSAASFNAHAQTYQYKHQAQGLHPATCPWGGSALPDGASVTGFTTPTADLGGCVSETRTCSQGTLSGSAPYQSCTTTSSTTWDPNSKWDSYNGAAGKNVMFSNGNLSVGESDWGQQSFAAATKAHTTGKWYFELTVSNVLFADLFIGLTDGTPGGWAAMTNGYNGGAFTGNISNNRLTSFSYSNPVMVAVDLDARKIWVGSNCVWSASGNPSAGTNPSALLVNPGSVKPLWRSGYTWGRPNPTNLTTANFGASTFTCAVPTGFNPGW